MCRLTGRRHRGRVAVGVVVQTQDAAARTRLLSYLADVVRDEGGQSAERVRDAAQEPIRPVPQGRGARGGALPLSSADESAMAVVRHRGSGKAGELLLRDASFRIKHNRG